LVKAAPAASALDQGFLGKVTLGLVKVLSSWLGADDDAYILNGTL
jgi:hypothetical protein